MLALLRAMLVLHRRAQRLDVVRTGLSLLIAALGLLAVFVDTATAITIAGALWAVIYSAGLARWTDGELRRAAVLQEMFDVRLFGLPWNPLVADEQISAAEINRLGKRYDGPPAMILDYYDIPDLPYPFDVLGCQQQNLGWGARIRQRYARTVLAAIVVWSAAGVAIGAFTDLTVGQVLLRWYVPSLGIFLFGLDIFQSQRAVAAARERALRVVRSRVAAARREPTAAGVVSGLELLTRQVQDVIFLTRVNTPRVPEWFFRRFHASDRADFRAAVDAGIVRSVS